MKAWHLPPMHPCCIQDLHVESKVATHSTCRSGCLVDMGTVAIRTPPSTTACSCRLQPPRQMKAHRKRFWYFQRLRHNLLWAGESLLLFS